ncbi:hypothetical protein M066_2928 [Bacteroides fragilis str. I1345]|nr:hypothetical protein M080_2664 [Bacteroides fragilis str. 3397 T10]EXY64994.1 hypothetical protein M085_2547 [Bacteroides fragilis str. 3986 N(B)19]EXZ48334.1 hypothetical protein M109_2835 [Bacteroides fragilis str. 3397 N2]EXZ53058.1 hypothetical protein M108_2916 [Bacteroides fragilis str. 3397 T14]EYA47588.1 hypothetical protein M115_2753 [Bacteroides fragilis str. 3719 T6]EYB18051.1 hypothetical protein M066_2928 [Bacteroides fragilis str. I1345]
MDSKRWTSYAMQRGLFIVYGLKAVHLISSAVCLDSSFLKLIFVG